VYVYDENKIDCYFPSIKTIRKDMNLNVTFNLDDAISKTIKAIIDA
jgi:hypothetical protein